MTIFLESVKRVFKTEISAIPIKSKTDDASLLNTAATTAASFFTFMAPLSRNPELSDNKRALAETFAREIEHLTNRDNDLLLKQHVDELIMRHLSDARKISRAKHSRLGNFGEAMDKLTLLLRNIYLTLERTNLLNIAVEETPLYHFRHFMAGYFVCHMINTEDSQTEKIALSEEKETAVIKALVECNENLQTIKPDLSDYHDLIKRRVGDFLLALREENKKLVKKYQVTVSLPITLSFLATINVPIGTWDRSIGELEVATIKALMKIDPERCRRELPEELSPAATTSFA